MRPERKGAMANRLLSMAQLEDCLWAKPGSTLTTAQRIATAQDKQTAAIVEWETLKAVRRWLQTKCVFGAVTVSFFIIDPADLTKLSRGEKPEGVE